MNTVPCIFDKSCITEIGLWSSIAVKQIFLAKLYYCFICTSEEVILKSHKNKQNLKKEGECTFFMSWNVLLWLSA